MLNAMAPPVRSRSGRAEFGRLYLRSLIDSAEERVELHRTRGHRLRRWVATRRLRKLLAYENQRHARIGAVEPAPPRVAVALVSVAWLASLVSIGILHLEDASELWLSVVEVPMLVLAAAWFFLAVACIPVDRTSLDQVTTSRH